VMDAVSFRLPDIDCAVKLAMMAEKVLEIVWGRAPTIDDVTSIEWRFLETQHGRGRSRRATGDPAGRTSLRGAAPQKLRFADPSPCCARNGVARRLDSGRAPGDRGLWPTSR